MELRQRIKTEYYKLRAYKNWILGKVNVLVEVVGRVGDWVGIFWRVDDTRTARICDDDCSETAEKEQVEARAHTAYESSVAYPLAIEQLGTQRMRQALAASIVDHCLTATTTKTKRFNKYDQTANICN